MSNKGTGEGHATLGAGRKGGPGGSSSPIASIDVDSINAGGVELDAYDTSTFVAGTEYTAFVESVGDYFGFRRGSTLTPDGITVINASGTAGAQWVRLKIANIRWQSQLTWSFDGSNTTGVASDENTGVDDAHPLLTMRELARRVKGALYANGTSCVVRILSSMVATDGAYFEIAGIGTPPANIVLTPFPQQSFFNLIGIPTVAYTGVVAGAQNGTGGGILDTRFTDASAPAFATTAALWRRNNGVVSYAWPAKDLTGGTFRTSQLASLAARTWVNGDGWSILTLPTINNLSFSSMGGNLPYQVAFVNEKTVSTAQINAMGSVVWYGVQFVTAANGGGALILGQSRFVNCRDFTSRLTTQSNSIQINQQAGGLISVASTLPAGIRIFMSGIVTYQGVGLVMDYMNELSEFAGLFFDLGATAAVTMNFPNAKLNILSIGGNTNTGKIFNIQGPGSNIVYPAAVPPPAGMTTDAAPFQVRAATAAAGTPIIDANYLAMIQAN